MAAPEPGAYPADGGRATLFGWPDALAVSPQPGSLCAFGAPSDTGNAISRGAALAPAAVRKASRKHDVPAEFASDFGDVDFRGRTGSAQHLEVTAETVRRIMELKGIPLLIGGDHSLTFAPISLLQETRDICLLWLDAHTDFSPWDGQEFHNHKQVLRRIETLPGVTRILQFGYRGVTVGDERRLGPKSSVVTSAEMQCRSPSELLEMVPPAMPCYISIDIDVIDPFHAPGTSAPVPGGLVPDTVIALLGLLARNRTIAGVDVVEVNPAMDRKDDTARIAARLIETLAANWSFQIERQRFPANGAPEIQQSPKETAP
ncbi:MAG: arginase family protein [Erythrobacter sp.]|nr:arginase family protein [Erythrobacter sp.]